MTLKKAVQTKMPRVPLLCLLVLAAVIGISLGQPLVLIIKLFIVGDSTTIICLSFVAYKFFLQEEEKTS